MSVKIYPTKWLPKSKRAIRRFIRDLKKKIEADPIQRARLQKLLKLHPPVNSHEEGCKSDLQLSVSREEIKSLLFHEPVEKLYMAILTDPEINMFFHQMFWQQSKDPDAMEIPNWQIFIILLNFIMDYTPIYTRGVNVGFPINALINWPMATTAGFACFLNDKVNRLFKNILNYWGKHLESPASAWVLNERRHGWFCEDALNDMMDHDGNTFEQQFVCDKNLPHWGFTSWDDFFTRSFRPQMRPLTQPDNPSIIANACESAPFKILSPVSARNTFWIKDQPYSLSHMLNNNEWYKYFVGGTVYQGFLSATSYHRWHSPISGMIVDIELIDGSYYSQTYDIQDDPSAPNMSQGYVSHVAARAAIYIKADNPIIGVLGFLSVGMSEASSNEVTVTKGQHVSKGDQLGMFHFGGSTHCLIFRKELDVQFDLSPNEGPPGLDCINIPLRRKIAEVSLKTTDNKYSKL